MWNCSTLDWQREGWWRMLNAIHPLDGRIFAYELILKTVTGSQLVLPNHYQISTKLIAGCLLVTMLTFRYTTFQRAILWIGASDNSLARIWTSVGGSERERPLASNVMDCCGCGYLGIWLCWLFEVCGCVWCMWIGWCYVCCWCAWFVIFVGGSLTPTAVGSPDPLGGLWSLVGCWWGAAKVLQLSYFEYSQGGHFGVVTCVHGVVR